METGQWEYVPRYVTVERGRLISQDCATCGQSIDIGHERCTNCQEDRLSKGVNRG